MSAVTFASECLSWDNLLDRVRDKKIPNGKLAPLSALRFRPAVNYSDGDFFPELGRLNVQIQVAQGTADFRVRHLEDNENYEIDTPNLAFSILRLD